MSTASAGTGVPNTTAYVHELAYVDSEGAPAVPAFQVMDGEGKIRCDNVKNKLDTETLVKMYKTMVQVNAIDTIFTQAQRQGKVSFHMQSYGEEALQVASAAAFNDEDHLFFQYREMGVFLWRGFDIEMVANQCFSNEYDLGKGRQMPIHFGSKKLNMYTVSSPLTTQLPQAVGVAYALKRRGEGQCVGVYFGDGAASEGDFHAAMNFAATLESPVIFFCRNNGWAISTPIEEQFRGDGILSRAPGYGMRGVRVDGNDPMAVYEATCEARAYAVENNRPVLLEAMSYRRGDHSTSDDSSRYRPEGELEWWENENNPLLRVRRHLESLGAWNAELEDAIRKESKKAVIKAVANAEKALKPPIEDLFTDVYEVPTDRLKRQQEDLMAHLDKYGDEYGLEAFAKK